MWISKFICFCCAAGLMKWPCLAETNGECIIRRNPNGTISFHLNQSVQQCDTYIWNINGTECANEDHFHDTLVESHGPSFCTFYSCHDNVTYIKACSQRMNVNCSGLCNTVSSPEAANDTNSPSGGSGNNWLGWLMLIPVLVVAA